jgi:hypothetical protein
VDQEELTVIYMTVIPALELAPAQAGAGIQQKCRMDPDFRRTGVQVLQAQERESGHRDDEVY